MHIFKQKKDKDKVERPSPQILDFRKNVIRLPNGDVIRKEDILHIDTQHKIIVYIGSDRKIREVKYETPS